MLFKIKIRLEKTFRPPRYAIAKKALLVLLLCFPTLNAWSAENNYLIGRGIHDVTGPAAEVGLMGYANLDQKSAGIHFRQWSRAYVVAEPNTDKRVVFVSVDAGALFQSVFQGVIQKLKNKYGDTYNERNVILSATHTHSAVGGQSHYALYDITILGFIEQAYNAQVDGIVASIEKAHNDLKPGRILVNRGDLSNASYNRSIEAYNNNPSTERNQYNSAIEKPMTVLKLLQESTNEVGMISWFATHPNAMGADLKVLSGDNKGHASYLFEKHHKHSTYQGNNNFVAAFAISNAGDMSPNVNPDIEGRGPTSNRFENVRIIGERQYEKALELYNSATEQLTGSIEFSHRYVDMSSTTVSGDFTDGEQKTTCVAALGESFAAGTEDGRGPDLFSEGATQANPFFQFIGSMIVAPSQADLDCHAPKAVLIAQGKTTPYPWTPEVLPLSLHKIGQLGILAVPAEFTIMSGRRLMNTVESVLSEQLDYTVVAGLSNAYSGYVTTKEEYDIQHYEGGSTHFGPWTLAAYQQSFYQLAANMLPAGQSPAPNLQPVPFPAIEPIPRDLTGETINFQTGVIHDQAPIFKRIGDIVQNAKRRYQKSESVVVKFWSGHPKNNLRTQGTFMEVQRWDGGKWVVVANDNDWETVYEWKRIDGFWGTSHAILTWNIPENAASGTYRIRHYGDKKKPGSGRIVGYTGTSRNFTVN
ncbi:neutral/alkaline ceramidase [Alkalimarinus sediminis]|uniref:Neutral ceramidase n=1 Tax=Alkalimarinus sediminis TaxID=1632866 RepID=A0A9E8KPC1_9ALTE|nr:neutral/alkaline ceramidase [Alkalimarinus sediminis]UZW73327.1 neutral/alkaline ceramidase [Alkalimarinus sediminis]